MARSDAYEGAYLLEGDAGTLEILAAKLAREGIIRKGDPDLYLRAYRSFGIDDARELRERAQRRAVAGGRRVFAFFAPGMTSDAQNALLKVLEEPPAGALFFIVAPSPHTLLPTLRSRTQPLSLEGTHAASDADAFLAAAIPARLEMLKPLYEHGDEGRDMASVIALLHALERRFARERPSPQRDEGVRAVYRALKFAGDKGSLLKPLLEQVALLAPKI